MLNRSACLAMSTSILKALPGKFDIKRHSPSILYLSVFSFQTNVFGALLNRVPTSSGNHGKPGKSLKKVPCMEKSWICKNPELSWQNHGIL